MSLMNRFFTAVALVVLSLAIVAKAEDQGNCSNASLHGNFGLRATGRTLAGGDIIVLGRFTYDGKGILTATLLNRLPNAANETFTITGTYSVRSDCTVSDVWHPGQRRGRHHARVGTSQSGEGVLHSQHYRGRAGGDKRRGQEAVGSVNGVPAPEHLRDWSQFDC